MIGNSEQTIGSDENNAEIFVFGEPSEEINSALCIDIERANELITDSLAKDLLKRGRELIRTSGNGKAIVNVDTLSTSFASGEKVDINEMKKRGILSEDTGYVKILARGSIDKPLFVYANEFSLSAVKMIALTGGEAIKVSARKKTRSKNKHITIEKYRDL